MNTCPVNASIGTVAVLVITALSSPPTEAGLVYPEPELFSGITDIVADGEVAVDPRNVKSGSIRLTNAKLCPSSISNSDVVMYE